MVGSEQPDSMVKNMPRMKQYSGVPLVKPDLEFLISGLAIHVCRFFIITGFQYQTG
jgi:hypothetical protein